jgi:hypothetical protein
MVRKTKYFTNAHCSAAETMPWDEIVVRNGQKYSYSAGSRVEFLYPHIVETYFPVSKRKASKPAPKPIRQDSLKPHAP